MKTALNPLTQMGDHTLHYSFSPSAMETNLETTSKDWNTHTLACIIFCSKKSPQWK